MVYVALKETKRGEVNFLMYNINAGMSVEVKVRREIEIIPHLISEKLGEGQLIIAGMYRAVDIRMFGDYIVMLIEDSSKELWISVKFLTAPMAFKHLKLVKLDRSIRLGDQSKFLLLSELNK